MTARRVSATPIARAVDVAGLEDFRFHDVRHTFASYLAMSGATLAEIADCMGRKTLVIPAADFAAGLLSFATRRRVR